MLNFIRKVAAFPFVVLGYIGAGVVLVFTSMAFAVGLVTGVICGIGAVINPTGKQVTKFSNNTVELDLA